MKNISRYICHTLMVLVACSYCLDAGGQGKSIQVEKVGKPILIYEATKPEKWGYVQFPRIMKNSKGELCVAWNMAEDNITAKANIDWKYSSDGGKTWHYRKNERPVFPGTILPNGDEIRFVSTKESSKNLELPQSKLTARKESSNQKITFYKASSLDRTKNTFQILKRKRGSTQYQKGYVVLNDPIGYRYQVDGIYPKQAWGDITVGKSGELLKVNYPFYTLGSDNKIQPSGVGIYNSTDNGKTWSLKSHIEYQGDRTGRTITGFSEPFMAVMPNGNDLLLVLRTMVGTKTSPMFTTISYDNGKTWSTLKKLSENGVLPQILVLENDVVVISSGRPGVQVRFSADNGKSWSNLLELVNKAGTGQSSCGYTGLLALNDNEFFIVYSDFKHRNKQGKFRKAIMLQRIRVTK